MNTAHETTVPGLYGAIVTDEPSEGDVMAAVRRGIAALRGGVS